MNEDLPTLELVPKTIVTLLSPHDPPFYTLETGAEVRDKIVELKSEYDDSSGFIVLTEVELHTRPEVLPEAVERSINPQLIGHIKDVHARYWEDQLKVAANVNEDWKHQVQNDQGGDPLAGMPEPVRALVEGLSSGQARFINAGGKGMTAQELGADGGPETECCCGHPAQQHEPGDKVGACEQCGCARFHTH